MPPAAARLVPLLLVACALAAGLAFQAAGAGGPVGFPLDDAWIHLVYARALAAGDGHAYNPGVPASGCTAPLWALLLAVPTALTGGAPVYLVPLVQALGLGFHAAMAVLAWRLARPVGEAPAAAVGLVLAASPALLAAALSGMEVSLAATLLLAALLAARAGRTGAYGLAVGLLLAVRPEATLAAAVAFPGLRASLSRAGSGAAWARLAAGPVVIGGALAAWNVHASGLPLPATFYQKAEPAGLAVFSRLGVVVVDFLPQAAPLTGWVLLAAALLALHPAGRAGRVALGAGVAFLVANVLVIPPTDPKAFYHLRYLLPAVPPLAVAGAAGLAALVGLAGRGAPDPARGVRVAAAVLLFGGAGIASTWGPVVGTFHNSVRNLDEVQVRMGRWLGEALPAGAWIAASDAGAVRYFSDHPVVDVMGLNTPELHWEGEAWRDAHPVRALALIIPDWFQPVANGTVAGIARFRTEGYTVTGFPAMAQQLVVSCVAPGPLGFRGIRDFTVACEPWAPAP